MGSKIKKIIPRRVKKMLKAVAAYIVGFFCKNKRKYCNCCRREVPFFKGAGLSGNAVLEKYEVIGGGRREHVICPLCDSNDRCRWVWYVLEHYLQLDGKKILHFAPEAAISRFIKERNGGKNYFSGDIVPGKADYVVDITNISFDDRFFDMVICNHVLEHIKDESKAIRELMRVTAHGGHIILTVPWSNRLEHTIEDTSEQLTDEDRLAKFGQKDHVRIHGLDFKEYLESFGLTVQEYVVENILSDQEIDHMSLIRNDRVFVCVNS